jgi:tRNA (guanine37-N1)-methyltransferase
MKISVITLFPKMISGFFDESIIKRAQEKKLVEIELINLRDFAIDDYGTVDDRPYGGGAGMILKVDVIHKALTKVKSQKSKVKITSQKSKVILTSAKGITFNQQLAINYSQLNHLIIIAGHYEGVDERVLNYVDEEVSLGDFVMTGGEIAASAIVDSIIRLIPSVLKKDTATKIESYFDVSIHRIIDIIGKDKRLIELKNKGVKTIKLLEYPQYTRPEIFNNKKVPGILLSGDHKKIEDWQIKKAFEETLKKRPDLLEAI